MTTETRRTGVVKKIDPRNTYNRFGIEVPDESRWLWVSYFGNLHPNTVGASIAFDLAADKQNRPYIAEYNILDPGNAPNPSLNRSRPDGPPQGVPPKSADARQDPNGSPAIKRTAAAPPRALPAPLSTDALLEFVAQVGLKYAELGEGDSLDDCFEKAAELAMKLDTKLTAYRRTGLTGPPQAPQAPRPSNPTQIAAEMAKRAQTPKAAPEDPVETETSTGDAEFEDDIPF